MTTAARDAADWRLRAACRGLNTDDWFGRPTETSAAVAICAHCPVRVECLHECMQVEIPTYRYGVYGGLTAAQRRALPAESQYMTIAALRRLLDEIDAQGGPEAARHNRLHLPDDEGTPEPMTSRRTQSVVDRPHPAHRELPVTAPNDPRIRPTLSLWCSHTLRRCYPGQVPATVIERALRMLAQADGHLTPDGNPKHPLGDRPARRQP